MKPTPLNTTRMICGMLLLIGVCLKLWLVHKMEISDGTDDTTCYIAQILTDSGSLFGPGTGYVGRFFLMLGIPFRVGIEMAWLLASFVFIRSLFDWPSRDYTSLALYLLLIYNPAAEELFSHILSDQVWLVETIGGLALFILASRSLVRFRALVIFCSALLLGLSIVTRFLYLPLLTALLIWALLAAMLSFFKGAKADVRPAIMAFSYLALLGWIYLIYLSVCYANLKQCGYYGLSAVVCPQYQSLYMSMQSVGKADGEKYFPIDENRRKLIATAGPDSKWLMDKLDQKSRYKDISLKIYGKRDIGAAWISVSVYEAILDGPNFYRAFPLFDSVNREIAEAAQEKRLTVRPILPLPDCRTAIVLSALPSALHDTFRAVMAEPHFYFWNLEGGRPTFTDRFFSLALLRQEAEPSPLRVDLGKKICVLYSWLYQGALFYLFIAAVLLFLIMLAYRWKTIDGFSFYFMAQQLYLLFFVVVFFWYAGFGASGLPVANRYLVFNNISLPILAVYYARKSWDLYKQGSRPNFQW